MKQETKDLLKELEEIERKIWEESPYRSEELKKFPNQHPSFDSPFMPPGEPVTGKTYRADGWRYIDPHVTFSPEMWDLYLSAFGEGEYHILATSMSSRNGVIHVRGQILVSPRGMENAAKFKVP